jgi:Flp pilus assembly protein TadG
VKITTMKHKSRQRGSVIVEFGLSFLVFLFALYGVMEFGRIVACYNILAGAAREGARYASVHGSSSGSAASASDVQTFVRNWAVGMDSSSVAVTTTWTPGNGPGGVVKVSASYTVTPFTGLILTSGMNVKSSSQMVISQ